MKGLGHFHNKESLKELVLSCVEKRSLSNAYKYFKGPSYEHLEANERIYTKYHRRFVTIYNRACFDAKSNQKTNESSCQ